MKGRQRAVLENDNQSLKQEPNKELDRFSSFMFGRQVHRNSHKETHRETQKEDENISQDFSKPKESSSSDRKTNQFDHWLFGSKGNAPKTGTNSNLNQIESILNNVDLDLLMETVDMFVATSKQLKPLFNEITPLFKQFGKKLKFKKED